MKELLNYKAKLVMLISTFLLIIVTICLLLVPYGEVGFILLILTCAVALTGLIAGVTYALGTSLVLFFIVGSVIFWISFSGVSLFDDYISMLFILYWAVGQFLIAVISGKICHILSQVLHENNQLKKEIQDLVAVDAATGFDNKNRMFLELELEFDRSKRYGHTFTFLLIKMNYYDQFRKSYGEAELTNVLDHIAGKLYKLTRISDQKFRPEKNMFALLLTDTPSDRVELVIKKLNQDLAVFKLKNNKFVTLSFEYGPVGFDEELKSYFGIYELALEQVDEDV